MYGKLQRENFQCEKKKQEIFTFCQGLKTRNRKYGINEVLTNNLVWAGQLATVAGFATGDAMKVASVVVAVVAGWRHVSLTNVKDW